MHKHDPIEYAAKKAAREQLKQPHTPPNSVPGLRERVYLIEKLVGINSETGAQS